MYKGPIAKLKKHGLGKMFFKNGDKYIGDFTNGEITGKGVTTLIRDQLLQVFGTTEN